VATEAMVEAVLLEAVASAADLGDLEGVWVADLAEGVPAEAGRRKFGIENKK
jgi:hypothetical protein